MATYRSSEAYDFSLFEAQVVEQPKIEETPAKKVTKTTKPKSKNKEQNILDANGMTQTVERSSQSVGLDSRIKRAMVVFAVFCSFSVCILAMNSKINELNKSIAEIESKIDIEEGEAVRLNSILSSKISSDKIESYAENELGMVLAESYQISYIDLSDGDEIVVSGDKTLEGQDGISGKIKQLLAYIF